MAAKSKKVKRSPYDADPVTGALRGKMNVLPYGGIPFQEFVDAYSRVSEHGRVRYGDQWNWSRGLPRTQIIGSLLRHTFAYLRGEDLDSDSGLSHTDHILWNAVALCHSSHHGIMDDRTPEPPRDYSKLKK